MVWPSPELCLAKHGHSISYRQQYPSLITLRIFHDIATVGECCEMQGGERVHLCVCIADL
jgi:hypothetical protein